MVRLTPPLTKAQPVLREELARGRPGVVWSYAFADGLGRELEPGEDGEAADFVWTHLNLADQRSRAWLAECEALPDGALEFLDSAEDHQRVLIGDDGGVMCLLHDFTREFARGEEAGDPCALYIILGDKLVVSGRHRPSRSAESARRRVKLGAQVADPPALFALVALEVVDALGSIVDELVANLQAIEDQLLDTEDPPGTRRLMASRRRAVRVHRQLNGLRQVFHRLDAETEDEVSPHLADAAARLAQALDAIDSDMTAVEHQARLLREEIDFRATQRTNQNLYILSVISALILPATLVTGLFGMNTGGLPFAHGPAGTFAASVLVVLAAGGTYMILRAIGFFRR